MKNQKDCVVVLSGGQDSTTCLFWAIHKGYENIYAISFDYGQRHSIELEYAQNITHKIPQCIEHKILKVDSLNQLTSNALTRDNIEITAGDEKALPSTFVDGRNQIFLTFAAIYAKSVGATDIITGVCQTDFSGYPDCRDIFIKSLNTTLNLAMDYDFDLITPLMWLNKEQTWALADSFGALDIIKNETVTCYNGIPGNGCGECPACLLRQRGLNAYLAHKAAK